MYEQSRILNIIMVPGLSVKRKASTNIIQDKNVTLWKWSQEIKNFAFQSIFQAQWMMIVYTELLPLDLPRRVTEVNKCDQQFGIYPSNNILKVQTNKFWW